MLILQLFKKIKSKPQKNCENANTIKPGVLENNSGKYGNHGLDCQKELFNHTLVWGKSKFYDFISTHKF